MIPERHVVYCDQPQVVEWIENNTYKHAVEQLPIVCVDIFLYNPGSEMFLLVYRKNAPAKHTWWMPGGRLHKGESFFQAAQRKCLEEVKVKVQPIRQLGTYSTIFPDSEWECQTHTINTVVLAILSSESSPEPNADHTAYEWRPLEPSPHFLDPYLSQVYDEALPNIRSWQKSIL